VGKEYRHRIKQIDHSGFTKRRIKLTGTIKRAERIKKCCLTTACLEGNLLILKFFNEFTANF
jgi:hypothetical protein